MGRTLFITVAHKFPPGVFAGLRQAGIINAHPPVDRQAWTDAQTLVERVKAPEADPHSVFMPAPIRNVRQRSDSRRGGKHLPWHGPGNIRNFHVHDSPADDALSIWQV